MLAIVKRYLFVYIKRKKPIEKAAKTHVRDGFHASFYQFQIIYERG
jgi:hypothetical protein